MDTQKRKSLPALLRLLPPAPPHTAPLQRRCKEVRINNANKKGGVGCTRTLKHIYQQSLRTPRASTQAALVFCNSREVAPGIFFSGYQPRAGIKLSIIENWPSVSLSSSLAGPSHMRTEPFQVLPPPTLSVHGPEPTSHRCSVTGFRQSRTGPYSLAGRTGDVSSLPGPGFCGV